MSSFGFKLNRNFISLLTMFCQVNFLTMVCRVNRKMREKEGVNM